MTTEPVPAGARLLGFAGLLPTALACAVAASGNDRFSFAAFALGHMYAALILSFLGGLWWGLAAHTPQPPAWLWRAAVIPSLFALASFLPWAFAGQWPGPSLVVTGSALVASLVVDRKLQQLGIAPRWWMGLRMPLSVGLGVLTIVLGLLAL